MGCKIGTKEKSGISDCTRSFNRRDVANVLAEMIEYTIKKQWSPTLADISSQSIDSLPRPSKRTITEARKRMKSARSVIVELKAHAGDGNAYEGETQTSSTTASSSAVSALRSSTSLPNCMECTTEKKPRQTVFVGCRTCLRLTTSSSTRLRLSDTVLSRI